MNFLDEYLKKLEELFSYPKVQIERAISPLLSIFITDIINHFLKTNIKFYLPEFPLKKIKNNQSTNIDWLLVDEENTKLFFIEFKTTSDSFNIKQLEEYLEFIQRINEGSALFLYEELKQIQHKSKKKQKYSSILNKFDNENNQFSNLKNADLIYFAPVKIKAKLHKYPDIKIITFSDLPENLATAYPIEWKKIRKFLITIEKIDSG